MKVQANDSNDEVAFWWMENSISHVIVFIVMLHINDGTFSDIKIGNKGRDDEHFGKYFCVVYMTQKAKDIEDNKV